MGGAAGRADRELGLLRSVLGGLQHRPLPARAVRPAAGRGRPRTWEWSATRITAWSSRNRSIPPDRLDQLSRSTRRPWRSTRRSRLGPVAVGVVVVVGQREEEEVEAVVPGELGGAAAGVAVAIARYRCRLARHLAAGVEISVEEVARAPGVVVEFEPAGIDDRPLHQTLERDLVAMAAAIDQERRAGGSGAGVVEALEQGRGLGAEVGEVHVVDEVVERPEDADRRGSPPAMSRTRRSAARAGGTSSCR